MTFHTTKIPKPFDPDDLNSKAEEDREPDDLCSKNEEERGFKYNNGKIMMSLVPASLNFAVGKVLTYGINKYTKRNWEKGMPFTELMDCFERHYNQFKSKSHDDYDNIDMNGTPGSGLHHLYHVASNLAMLIELLETHPECDDRFELPTKKEQEDKKETYLQTMMRIGEEISDT